MILTLRNRYPLICFPGAQLGGLGRRRGVHVRPIGPLPENFLFYPFSFPDCLKMYQISRLQMLNETTEFVFYFYLDSGKMAGKLAKIAQIQ